MRTYLTLYLKAYILLSLQTILVVRARIRRVATANYRWYWSPVFTVNLPSKPLQLLLTTPRLRFESYIKLQLGLLEFGLNPCEFCLEARVRRIQ